MMFVVLVTCQPGLLSIGSSQELPPAEGHAAAEKKTASQVVKAAERPGAAKIDGTAKLKKKPVELPPIVVTGSLKNGTPLVDRPQKNDSAAVDSKIKLAVLMDEEKSMRRTAVTDGQKVTKLPPIIIRDVKPSALPPIVPMKAQQKMDSQNPASQLVKEVIAKPNDNLSSRIEIARSRTTGNRRIPTLVPSGSRFPSRSSRASFSKPLEALGKVVLQASKQQNDQESLPKPVPIVPIKPLGVAETAIFVPLKQEATSPDFTPVPIKKMVRNRTSANGVAAAPVVTQPVQSSLPESPAGKINVALESRLAPSRVQTIVNAAPQRIQPQIANQFGLVTESSSVPRTTSNNLNENPIGLSGNATDCLADITLPSSPRAFLSGEALYMTREGGTTTFSDSFSGNPFAFELGLRIRAERINGPSGPSLTYTGMQEWNQARRFNRPASDLGIRSTSAGLAATTLDPFTNANFQQQYHTANLHSLELNSVTWGWDVINIFYGIRYTQYQEEFDFFSSRADGQQARLLLDMENHLFGPQVGGEIFYDVGGRLSTGVKLKAGLMANSFDGETVLFSNNTEAINNSDSDLQFSFLGEMSFFTRFRIGQRAYLRSGYEVWYNSKTYGVSDNLPAVMTPNYGTTTVDNDLLIHGGTIGLEIVW